MKFDVIYSNGDLLVYEKRFLRKRKFIGTVTSGGMMAVKTLMQSRLANKITYNFVNFNDPSKNAKNLNFK